MVDLPEALSPHTTQTSTPNVWPVRGGDLLVSAEATILTGDDDVRWSLGDGLLARLRAPLESIFIGDSTKPLRDGELLFFGLPPCFPFLL